LSAALATRAAQQGADDVAALALAAALLQQAADDAHGPFGLLALALLAERALHQAAKVVEESHRHLHNQGATPVRAAIIDDQAARVPGRDALRRWRWA
jgi:hypothetical protein